MQRFILSTALICAGTFDGRALKLVIWGGLNSLGRVWRCRWLG
ncbi:hypothetical protein [Edwardsiella ictaluri]